MLKENTTNTKSNNNNNNNTPINNNDEQDARFSCNVCLDPVKDPVVTQCGHLYCWSCLFRWLRTHHTTCPVCKSGVTEENIIPIYIRGSEQDPRTKSDNSSTDVPNRPQGRRIDASTQNVNAPGLQANPFGGFTITTSYGFFPSLFGLQFQSFTPNPREGSANIRGQAISEEESQQLYLSRAVYVLASVVIFCLLLF